MFRHDLVNNGAPAVKQAHPPRWTAPQVQGLALLLAVTTAYPVVATLHWSPYVVAEPGAPALVSLCWYHGAGPPVLVVRTGVAWDILVFLAGYRRWPWA